MNPSRHTFRKLDKNEPEPRVHHLNATPSVRQVGVLGWLKKPVAATKVSSAIQNETKFREALDLQDLRILCDELIVELNKRKWQTNQN